MTVFYVLGGVLAAWALIVTALGVTQENFPGKGTGERVVGAISVTLVAAAIGSAIISSANEDEEEGDEAEAAETAPAGGGGGGGGELRLMADPSGQLRFDKTELSGAPGEVTITMTNPSSTPHNVALEGDGVDEKGEVVANGESMVSAELAPGDYTFYCSVPGHRQAGMEGTLSVE